jgi:hypothetical protein
MLLAGILLSLQMQAQVSIIDGINLSMVRNHVLENEGPIIGAHIGPSVKFRPFRNADDLALRTDLLLTLRGYHQDLDKRYAFRFFYIAPTITLDYSIIESVSIYSGFEFSYLVKSNIEKADETYNNFDIGIVLGMAFFENKRIGFYWRGIYGLVPMLDYYHIDSEGNFHGQFHDLRNLTFSLGLKINILHDEIRSYK